MNTTVQEVFDQAIHLMDEQNETTGATETVDTGEYKKRTISILNAAIARLYPYSSNYDRTTTGRPRVRKLYCDNYSEPDFDQIIMLDDAISLSVLPFFLAANLLSGENDSLAAWFMNQYRENLADIKRNTASAFEAIDTPYGLF